MGKANKNSKGMSAKKFENELPEVARRHNIRVSSPYGYYPEDVDKIIVRFEEDVSSLEKENGLLSKKIEKQAGELKSLQFELTQLKMQVSLMEIPDTSTEQDFAMMGSGLGTITGQPQDQVMPQQVQSVPHTDLNAVQTNQGSTQQQATYSNLIRPKKLNIKPKGEN